MAVVKRRPLSRRRILEAAVRFVDREGLDALSMRKLGSELGVEAMSLYNHVPNKSALLDGMVEVLLGELEIPPEDEGWERRVRGAYRAFRRLAHEHPNVFPLLVVRPPETMDGIWLVEEFLKTLREAGFDPQTALYAFRALQLRFRLRDGRDSRFCDRTRRRPCRRRHAPCRRLPAHPRDRGTSARSGSRRRVRVRPQPHPRRPQGEAL